MRTFTLMSALMGMLAVFVASVAMATTTSSAAATLGAGFAKQHFNAAMVSGSLVSASTSLTAATHASSVSLDLTSPNSRFAPNCCLCLNKAISNELLGCVGGAPGTCIGCPLSARPGGDNDEGFAAAVPFLYIGASDVDSDDIEFLGELGGLSENPIDNPTWPVTIDGRCDPDWGHTCVGSEFGPCCNFDGECGRDMAHCTVLRLLEEPWSETSSAVFYTRAENDSATEDTINSALNLHSKIQSALPISDDGTCGPFSGGKTCAGFSGGSCCSIFGYCGFTSDYCAKEVCLGNPYGTCSFGSLVPPADAQVKRDLPVISFDPLSNDNTTTTFDPSIVAKQASKKLGSAIYTLTHGLGSADIAALTSLLAHWTPARATKAKRPTTTTTTESFDPAKITFDPLSTNAKAEQIDKRQIGDITKVVRTRTLSLDMETLTALVTTRTHYEAVTTITANPTTTTVQVAYASVYPTRNNSGSLVTLVNPLVPDQTVVRGAEDSAFPTNLAQLFNNTNNDRPSIDINTFQATNMPTPAGVPVEKNDESVTIESEIVHTHLSPDYTSSGEHLIPTELTQHPSNASDNESSGKALVGYNGPELMLLVTMGMLACFAVALLL